MPAGAKVRPGAWSNVINVFDNGYYSAIWGSYHKSVQRRLGVRWNGGEESPSGRAGYPNQGGHSLWYVELDAIAAEVLKALKTQIETFGYQGKAEEHLRSIEIALKELSER